MNTTGRRKQTHLFRNFATMTLVLLVIAVCLVRTVQMMWMGLKELQDQEAFRAIW